jgi:hypothetical protein
MTIRDLVLLPMEYSEIWGWFLDPLVLRLDFNQICLCGAQNDTDPKSVGLEAALLLFNMTPTLKGR